MQVVTLMISVTSPPPMTSKTNEVRIALVVQVWCSETVSCKNDIWQIEIGAYCVQLSIEQNTPKPEQQRLIITIRRRPTKGNNFL